LKEVGTGAECGRGTGTDAGMAKPPKIDGTTSWVVFWCQFKTVPEHNCWTCKVKSTYLITAMLYGVPKGATYEKALEALQDCFGDQHLAAVYRSQLKSKTQGAGEFLQEFSTAVEQLA
jgi:hypothetical protein